VVERDGVSLWCLRALAGALLAASLAAVLAPASGGTPAVVVALSITGRGFGHGMGLSQWGAEERASAGQSYRQILDFYYPSTHLGSTPTGDRTVRVLVAERTVLRLGSAAPFAVRDGAGRLLHLPAGHYLVARDGRLGPERVRLPLVAAPGRRPLQVGGTPYDGSVTVEPGPGRTLRAVDEVGLEAYVAGVVASECPGWWRPDALRAQAVASRTYALANLHPTAAFDLYADDRSQNYRGLARTFGTSSAAAAGTEGQILLYGGRPADALFSASNGGLTSDTGAGVGTPLPYLRVRRDAFDARSPAARWGPVEIPLSAIRRAFPAVPTQVVGVRVVRNAADRVAAIAFTGRGGTVVAIGGTRFQQRLGLRSTFFAASPAT
jgi:stage II sporulation protein D